MSNHLEIDLKISGEVYRSIVESTDDLINVLGPDGRFIFVNHGSETIYGKKPHECIGHHYDEFIHPDDLDETNAVVQSWIAEELATAHYHNRQISADGTVRDVSWNIALHYDDHGEIETIIAIGRDITERIRAEEALRESEYRLSLHMQNTPVGAISWDRDFVCNEWNKAAENIFGFSADEAIGTHPSQTIIPEAIRSEIDAVYAALLRQEGGSRSTNENLTRDGRTIICDWYNTPIFDHNGEVIGVASLVQDITERKRTEDELTLAKSEAENANKAKSDFLAAMSHDLRTPLNSILGFSQLLEQEIYGPIESDKYREYHRIIRGSADHLLGLVEEILDLSRLEANQFRINPEVFDPAEHTRGLIRAFEPIVAQKGIIIEFTQSENMPGYIRADRKVATQIQNNFISNAVRHAPNGSVVYVRWALTEQGTFTFEVGDSGEGFSETVLNSVGQPFIVSVPERASGTKKGFGLGLYICKRYIEARGGRLKLYNKPEGGAMIVAEWPSEILSAS